MRDLLHKVLLKFMPIYRTEREKYEKHRRKSQKHPKQYISMIIDGMDQSKTNLPHVVSNQKILSGCKLLKTHVTGVKVHGRGSHFFVDWGQFPQDTNLTLNILMQVFSDQKVCGFTLL